MNALITVVVLILCTGGALSIHTTGRCEAKYQDLLKEVATVHDDCGYSTAYNCCSITRFLNTMHVEASSVIHQAKSACPHSTFQSSAFQLSRCETKQDDGGWTVIFRRDATLSSRVSFDRNWQEYENGFGNLTTEFWYGLKEMHCLTQTGVDMRLDMTFSDSTSVSWTYSLFTISGAEDDYKLRIGQAVRAPPTSVQDAITRHFKSGGTPFTTKDNDNDVHPGNCAAINRGGWWWHNCAFAELTIPTMKWYTAAKTSTVNFMEMKIRPKTCNLTYN